MLLSLSLLPAPARAGQWVVSYSGSAADTGRGGQTYTIAGNQVTPSGPLCNVSGSGASLFNQSEGSATLSVTATLTWTPSFPGDTSQPPATLDVLETARASSAWSLDGPTGVSAGADDGLGDAATYPTPPQYGASSAGQLLKQYTLAPGQTTVTLPARSLSGSLTLTAGQGSNPSDTIVSYSAAVSAYGATIVPGGATSDGNGGWEILVGQHCAPALAVTGVPAGTIISNYQWTVSGPTFQQWIGNTPPTYESGPGPLNVASPGWFWDDRGNGNSTPETISCTATVTPPAGQGSTFTVTASQTVSVWVPAWAAYGVGGYVKVNLYDASSSAYEIFAGPTFAQLANGLPGGMNFSAKIASPNALFGSGSVELLQLVTPDLSFQTLEQVGEDNVILTHDYSQNGQEGLDGEWPYGGGWEIGSPSYQDWDKPGFPLNDSIISATCNIGFEDYLMYVPPGSVQYVPIARFIWNTDATAYRPSTGSWADYYDENGNSDAAGTVTPSGNESEFLEYNEFPLWTQINGNGTFGPNAPTQGATF